MVASYSDIIWATFFVEQLTAQEAIVVLASCSQAWRAMKAYLAPLAFAITRPKARIMGPPLTVKSWSRLWRMCAAHVFHHGLSVGLWARAEQVVCARNVIRDYFPTADGNEIRFSESHPFLDNSLKSNEIRVSAILMLGACLVSPEAKFGDIHCYALIVLANNQLGWICTRHISNQGCARKLWIDNDLDSLLTMVPASLSVRGVSLWANCNPFPRSLKRRRHPFSFQGAQFDVAEHPAKEFAGVARLLRQTAL